MTHLRIPSDVFYVDRSALQSLQVQIRQIVSRAIAEGRMLPGHRLPSTRELAAHLGISRITITLAYQELLAQGFIEVFSRSSYRIAESALDPGLQPIAGIADSVAVDWTDWITPELAQRRRVEKPADWRMYPYPFTYGQMDEATFDRQAWTDCVRRAHERRDFLDMARDVANADDPMLVNYIASRTLPRRGISAQTDEIIVTLGAQNALWLTIQLLTRNKLKVVCENPGHPDTSSALQWYGASVEWVDVDDKGLQVAKIPSGTGAVFVTPSHHSPTSVTMVRERREALLRLASSSNFLIVEDDYEFEMSFIRPPSPALKSLDCAGRVIYAGSFSKALFPGLRLGYLVASRPFIEQVRQLRALMFRHPPGHLQRTVSYFLGLGHYDKQMDKLRRVLRDRHDFLIKSLHDTPLEVKQIGSFGGSSLWIKGPVDLDSNRLAERLRAQGVLIEPGASFFANGHEAKRYFRLGYSSIPKERIAEGVKRVVACLGEP